MSSEAETKFMDDAPVFPQGLSINDALEQIREAHKYCDPFFHRGELDWDTAVRRALGHAEDMLLNAQEHLNEIRRLLERTDGGR